MAPGHRHQPPAPVAPRAGERGQAGDRPERHGAVLAVLHPDQRPDGRRASGGIAACQLDDVGLGQPGDGGHAPRRILFQPLAQALEAHCVPLDVVRVVQTLGHDDMHHPEGQGGIRAGHGLNVPVGRLRRPCSYGIDDDHRGAGAMRSLDEGPQVQVRDHGIGAPDHDEAGVHDVLGVDARIDADGGRHARLAVVTADGPLQARGTDPREEAAIHGHALDHALRPHVAVREDGLGTVLSDDPLERAGNVLEGLVPGDPGELPFLFRAGAPHWIEESLGVVDPVLEIPVDLRTQRAGGERVVWVAAQLDGDAVLHPDRPGTSVGTIVRAGPPSERGQLGHRSPPHRAMAVFQEFYRRTEPSIFYTTAGSSGPPLHFVMFSAPSSVMKMMSSWRTPSSA